MISAKQVTETQNRNSRENEESLWLADVTKSDDTPRRNRPRMGHNAAFGEIEQRGN
jgi:hypothetical protein